MLKNIQFAHARGHTRTHTNTNKHTNEETWFKCSFFCASVDIALLSAVLIVKLVVGDLNVDDCLTHDNCQITRLYIFLCSYLRNMNAVTLSALTVSLAIAIVLTTILPADGSTSSENDNSEFASRTGAALRRLFSFGPSKQRVMLTKIIICCFIITFYFASW